LSITGSLSATAHPIYRIAVCYQTDKAVSGAVSDTTYDIIFLQVLYGITSVISDYAQLGQILCSEKRQAPEKTGVIDKDIALLKTESPSALIYQTRQNIIRSIAAPNAPKSFFELFVRADQRPGRFGRCNIQSYGLPVPEKSESVSSPSLLSLAGITRTALHISQHLKGYDASGSGLFPYP